MKKHLIFPTVILLIIILSITVFAETKKAELFELDREQNMSVSVEYDKKAPKVWFIDPDGKEIKNAQVEDTGDTLYFRLPNAARGKWQIAYDKGTNKELTVRYAPYVMGVAIEDFSFTKTEDDRIEAKFKVDHDRDTYYRYTLYAVTMNGDAVEGQREIGSGSGRVGEEEEVSARIDGLETYDSYGLMLEVWIDDEAAEVFDTAVADGTFSYVDEDTPEPIEDFKVNVDSADGITVDWSEYSVYGNGYIVSVFDGNSTEPLFFDELESGESATSLIVDPAVANIRVELRYRTYDGISAPAIKNIDRTLLSRVSIEAEDGENGAQTIVRYDMTELGTSHALVGVNGETEEARLDGDGYFSVDLDSFDNEVSVTWTLPTDENVTYTVTAQPYVDRMSPSLKLYEITSSSPIRTGRKEYVLVGSTDKGCAVYVDGEEVETYENGAFSVTLALNDGTNTFTVTSCNSSGIKSAQTVVIVKDSVIAIADEKGDDSLLRYAPLALSLLLAVVITVFVLILGKKYPLRKERDGKTVAVLYGVRGVMILLSVVAAVAAVILAVLAFRASGKISSSTFIDTVSRSVTEAYELIVESDALRTWAVISGVVFGVGIVAAILISLLIKRIKAGPKPKAEKSRSKTVFCTNCGAENEKGQKFCTGCGSPLK